MTFIFLWTFIAFFCFLFYGKQRLRAFKTYNKTLYSKVYKKYEITNKKKEIV